MDLKHIHTGPFLSTSLLSILIITQIALLVLESAVAIIQSYVFAVLSTLYSREVNPTLVFISIIIYFPFPHCLSKENCLKTYS